MVVGVYLLVEFASLLYETIKKSLCLLHKLAIKKQIYYMKHLDILNNNKQVEHLNHDVLDNEIKDEETKLAQTLGIEGKELDEAVDTYLVDKAEKTINEAKEDYIVTPLEQRVIDHDVGQTIVQSINRASDNVIGVPIDKLVEDGFGSEVIHAAEQFSEQERKGIGIKHFVSIAIKTAYKKREREQVDYFKSQIESDSPASWDYSVWASKNIPSTTKQLGRLILDVPVISKVAVPIHQRSHKTRQKEAMSKALQEYETEKQAQFEENERLKLAEVQKRARQQLEKESQQKIIERKQLEKEFLDLMENYRLYGANRQSKVVRDYDKDKWNQVGRVSKERIQEESEKAFNNKLTKTDEIDHYSEIEGSGVSKRQIEVGDVNLDVYDLHGFPFSAIQHKLDYLSDYGFTDDPEKYLQYNNKQTRYQTTGIKENSWGISGSYIDSENNDSWRKMYFPRNYGYGEDRVVYGFDHIRPGTFIKASTDGGEANGIEVLGKVVRPEDMITNAVHNEIVLQRYNEDGKSYSPDFIIAVDDKINDNMKKHANFFGIPIINIQTEYYKSNK